MTRDQQIEQLITDYGIANADAIVQAHQQPNRPTLARCLALLENESGGRNVFGAEGTACPAEWYEQEVTQHRYTIYKLRRDQGLTPNGVGPTQLTDPTYQQDADQRGGCWIPLHNLEVGLGLLHALITRNASTDHPTPDDVETGYREYNGGPTPNDASINYALRATERAHIWERRLAAHGLLG